METEKFGGGKSDKPEGELLDESTKKELEASQFSQEDNTEDPGQSEDPSQGTDQHKTSYENQALKQSLKESKQSLKESKWLHHLRWISAILIFIVILCWLLGIRRIIWSQFIKDGLPDSVLLVLVTSGNLIIISFIILFGKILLVGTNNKDDDNGKFSRVSALIKLIGGGKNGGKED